VPNALSRSPAFGCISAWGAIVGGRADVAAGDGLEQEVAENVAEPALVFIGEPVMEFFDPTQPRQIASGIVAKARERDVVAAS
jgi:hypothetical protein